ncbi:hypothetical protein AMJ49_06380 [Parcubacteria bacterium DG_74_2]|nr:MAG: hypothetical protein AMJ49_06380 [Parcubacteria bacterium DG_74_2]
MEWFYLSLSSLFLFSLSSIVQRKLLRNSILNPVVFGFIFQVLVGLFAIPMFLIYKGVISASLIIWAYIIIAGILYSVSNFLFYHAVKITEISRISVIGSSRSLWVLIGSVFILGEKITLYNFIGIVLIVFSLALIFWNKQEQIKINKGQKFALFATVFSGIALVIDGLILRNFSVAFYLIISSLFVGVGTLAIKPKSIFKIKPFIEKRVFIPLVLCSFIFALAVFLMYSAFQIGGKMASVIPITQSSAIITIFLSALLLKETKDLPKKIIALILCIIGISFLK